jgi:hypothetical protein
MSFASHDFAFSSADTLFLLTEAQEPRARISSVQISCQLLGRHKQCREFMADGGTRQAF